MCQREKDIREMYARDDRENERLYNKEIKDILEIEFFAEELIKCFEEQCEEE